jgi:hypothetical protein
MPLMAGSDPVLWLGETASGTTATDMRRRRETWEEGCSVAPGPAGAIKTSLNVADGVTLACTSASSMAPTGMGPAGGGGRLGEVGTEGSGPAMSRAVDAAVAEGRRPHDRGGEG